MGKNKFILIITISALSLLGLVIMQINWILHAAQLREDQLRHRLALVSYRVANKLKRDTLAVAEIKSRLQDTQKTSICSIKGLNCEGRVDSILRNEFSYHHVSLPYQFEILDKNTKDYISPCSMTDQANTHGICLDNVVGAPKKAEIRLTFSNKEVYIYAQMGWMLTGSILLIFLVIGCFGITIYTLWKQKKVSDMTNDFINNMTHELKTPIATISLASNMLKRQQIVNNPPKITHYATVIHEENDKLQNQVEQVLRIARLERGDFKLQKCITDLHDLIQDAINTIDLQVREKGGQIQCYLHAMHHQIKADATHLTNVIANLLDNANKYSKENPEITITTYDNHAGVVIAVEDKGIGMSKDKQKHVFEKFYRVPTGNVHDVKGFGLGLAYVKMMVEAHKGQVQLHSELGKGSRFEIFLPIE
jgi:nitrogen-specific signal transduction histidine kinase